LETFAPRLRLRRFGGVVHNPQQVLGVFEKHLSRRGEGNAPTPSLEELYVQRFFQRPDVLADRRL
jgi:hypothetical protein